MNREIRDLFKKTRKPLKDKLTNSRYEHTLGVEYTAASLAMCYSADIFKAEMAGLLHDCAKCYSEDFLIEVCKRNDIPISDIEYKLPYLLHAKVGAFLAKDTYGIDDEEILSAIKYHSTGRENMTLLEKIVFVADYIEPRRDLAPNLVEIRKMAYNDIDTAVLMILEDTLNYLRTQSGEIDPATEETYNYYKKRFD